MVLKITIFQCSIRFLISDTFNTRWIFAKPKNFSLFYFSLWGKWFTYHNLDLCNLYQKLWLESFSGIQKLQYQILLKELRNCFTHYSCVLIILFNTDLNNSVFSTYSFGKLVFLLFVLSVFSVCSVFRIHLQKLYKIYMIIVYIGISYSVILFSLYKKQFVKRNITLRIFDYSS